MAKKKKKNHKHTCILQGGKLGSSVTHTLYICVIKLSVLVGAKNLGNFPLMGWKTERASIQLFHHSFLFVCFFSLIRNSKWKKGNK